MSVYLNMTKPKRPAFSFRLGSRVSPITRRLEADLFPVSFFSVSFSAAHLITTTWGLSHFRYLVIFSKMIPPLFLPPFLAHSLPPSLLLNPSLKEFSQAPPTHLATRARSNACANGRPSRGSTDCGCPATLWGRRIEKKKKEKELRWRPFCAIVLWSVGNSEWLLGLGGEISAALLASSVSVQRANGG